MNIKVRYTILLICSLIFSITYAQDYTIRDIEINANGESHEYRNFMQMDDDGFLWYSTYNGLVKDFETHNVLSTFLDEKTDNLPKNISGFFIDSKQRIWVSATTGIFVSSESLDDSSNRIEFKLFLKGWELQANSFIEDCDGNLWIAAGESVNNIILKVDPSFKVTEYQVPGIGSRYVDGPYFLRGYLHFERRIGCDKFLVRRGRKLFVLDKGKTALIADFTATLNYDDNFYYYPPWEWQYNGGDGLLITDNGDILPKSTETEYIYEGEIFKTYFIKDLDIQVLNLPHQEMLPISEDDNPILKSHADFIGIYDLGRKLGLYKMVEINGSFHLKKTYEIPIPNFIDGVVVDKEGIIYVTTQDRICKIKFSKKNFNKILDHHEAEEIDVRGFLELPNAEILAATNEGVFKLTPSEDTNNESSFETENVFPSLKLIKSFTKISDSTAWCFGETKGLLKINFLKNKIEEFHVFNSHWRLHSLHYYDILQSSDSTLLLASNFGLQEFNTRQNKFQELPIPIVENNRELFIWDLHKTKGRLFIGTDANGLFIQDLHSNTFLNLNKDWTNSGLALPSNKIHSIFVDRQENIWLGTDKGAIQIDKDLKELTVINEKDGLTNLNVVGILEDKDENMWFSTRNGLYRYRKSSKKITAFYVEDGLTSNDFIQTSYYRSSTGKLFFGGINGLIAFDSVVDIAQSQKVKIFPTKFEYYDTDEEKEVELDILNRDNYSFSLPYNKSSFSISYSINDCYNTDANKYLYRLEGVTDGWENLGNQTTLKLLSIPPGNHVLRVKGINSTGVKSANELYYDVHIAEVFYKQSWFLILSGFLIGGVLLLLVLRYASKLKKKHALSLALIELERKTLMSQMNPHFIFNALNEIRNRLKEGKTKGLGNYLTLFSKLTRLTLDVTRNERIQLSKEIDFIENYVALSNIDNDHEISLEVQYAANINPKDLVIPPMILQPVIENSIVHGFTKDRIGKEIILKIKKSTISALLIFNIEDNGMGIEKSKNEVKNKQHRSYASQILCERLHLMNQVNGRDGEYEITFKDLSDEQRTGTRVTIKIPYSRM